MSAVLREIERRVSERRQDDAREFLAFADRRHNQGTRFNDPLPRSEHEFSVVEDSRACGPRNEHVAPVFARMFAEFGL